MGRFGSLWSIEWLGYPIATRFLAVRAKKLGIMSLDVQTAWHPRCRV